MFRLRCQVLGAKMGISEWSMGHLEFKMSGFNSFSFGCSGLVCGFVYYLHVSGAMLLCAFRTAMSMWFVLKGWALGMVSGFGLVYVCPVVRQIRG